MKIMDYASSIEVRKKPDDEDVNSHPKDYANEDEDSGERGQY